ncbi:hypothetical protein K4H97_1552 [Streptococcus sanguinis]|nr:hypothetical protein [Streptococcus sanguinis]
MLVYMGITKPIYVSKNGSIIPTMVLPTTEIIEPFLLSVIYIFIRKLYSDDGFVKFIVGKTTAFSLSNDVIIDTTLRT